VTWRSACSFVAVGAGLVCVLVVASCGGTSPTSPAPKPPPSDGVPPQNALPSIDAVAAQGRRPKQPARFADAGETIDVTATVRDAETSVDELVYMWTAPLGTFAGSGKAVTWKAPDNVTAPTKVILTLKVTENYGYPGQAKSFSQNVTSTIEVALHDSKAEVGKMARDFLLDFSDTSIKDINLIMRNFGTGTRCPDPGEIASERDDVTRNFTYYDMKAYSVGQAVSSVNFGGLCAVPDGFTKGDACSVVPVMWDSVDTRTGQRGSTRGEDIVSATYSTQDSRWWLCSSRYRETSKSGAYRFIR
jgi:hypothetical protein